MSGVRTHWQVVNRFYPQPIPHDITEFEFGNGVCIHYSPEGGKLTMFLPVRELYSSVGGVDEVVQGDQCTVTLSRTEGVVTNIVIEHEEPVDASN